MERNVPRERWLYPDRGMAKWLGWILSDHSAYMEQEAIAEQPIVAKVEMTTAEIDTVLKTAWLHTQPISVQLNIEFNHHYQADVQGIMVGFADGQIYLQDQADREEKIQVDLIRHVELMTLQKWWQV
ncbi:DNA-directed RNA polymerase subunit beta [Lapidilactobacillus bayanensis]|uniref:DNA-directed RNA polymerase subunit beta n=1 Tax=Lapidilactobacillus bayanensis TaxID=2485998 RepID=UPI000F77662A|nr:DNA-directed RNA polymerase subunit beta [Lapidilactobacillus bayanensis]